MLISYFQVKWDTNQTFLKRERQVWTPSQAISGTHSKALVSRKKPLRHVVGYLLVLIFIFWPNSRKIIWEELASKHLSQHIIPQVALKLKLWVISWLKVIILRNSAFGQKCNIKISLYGNIILWYALENKNTIKFSVKITLSYFRVVLLVVRALTILIQGEFGES